MLQRPTILVKPSAANVDQHSLPSSSSSSSGNEVSVTPDSYETCKVKSRDAVSPDKPNPQVLANKAFEESFSSGNSGYAKSALSNSLNKVNGHESTSILANSNNKLKTKRELITPLVNNQKENAQQQVPQAQPQVQQSSSVPPLTNPAVTAMKGPVRVLDENLQWSDQLQEYLADQTDFLVVGVLGKKGVGKSTVMSLLANSKSNDLFNKASRDSFELGQHKTNGIQAFITNERTILLDVQVNY